jgi:hypothetical protein
MSWLITTRAFHGASKLVAPIRFDLDASDANIISGGRRASFRSTSRFVFILSVAVNEIQIPL